MSEPEHVALETFQRFRMDRPCPKCGSGPTPSRLCEVTAPLGDYRSKDCFHPYVPEGSHLHRECLHCGYERIEIALDAPLLAESRRQERAHKARTRSQIQRSRDSVLRRMQWDTSFTPEQATAAMDALSEQESRL